MSFLRASLTVGSLTLLSRFLGFIRDVLTAGFLGAGPIADAFFVALKLPNFFRRITAEGAFSVSFIPIFSRSLKSDGEEIALTFAGRVLSIMLLVMIPFVILGIIFMPTVISLIAPGFVEGGSRFDLAVDLARVTFGYIGFMSLVALLGGVLNAYDRFAPFAFVPVLFNLCLIGALVGLIGYTETAGHALAIGVIIAGVVQFLWLVIVVKRSKIRLTLRKPEKSQRVSKLFRLMGPGVLGAGIVQINVFVDMVLATLLPTGSVSYLYYADRLEQLPLGVIGIAIGTALLPKLSKSLAAGKTKEANALFNKALEYGLLLTLPAAAAFVIIPVPIVSVLFERGAFDAAATLATAQALVAYAVGIPAFVSIKIFASTFFAHENTKTPVKIAAIGAVTNIILSLILIRLMQHVGIALATSLAAWVQLILLWIAVKKYDGLSVTPELFKKAIFITLSSIGMGVALYVMHGVLSDGFNGSTTMRILSLIALVSVGKAVYATLTFATGVLRFDDLKQALKG